MSQLMSWTCDFVSHKRLLWTNH